MLQIERESLKQAAEAEEQNQLFAAGIGDSQIVDGGRDLNSYIPSQEEENKEG